MATIALSFTGKNIHLSLDDMDSMRTVAHALSTELRLQILKIVVDQAKSVGEIARILDVPVSTVALNVQVMENAGLVATEAQPGVRGMLKLVSRRADEVRLRLMQSDAKGSAVVVHELPVGAYSAAEGIQPTCGLAANGECFHMDDMPEAFWMPFRLKADLVWLREGTLEYHFPGVSNPERLTQLELSDRSSVSYGSIKRFEGTGKISLESLWLLAHVLGCDGQLDDLFSKPPLTADDLRNGR